MSRDEFYEEKFTYWRSTLKGCESGSYFFIFGWVNAGRSLGKVKTL